jgi:hypothetical protein
MPPPKAVTICSVVSKSDTSEELKKNLKETSLNALTNRKLYKSMLEELRDENVIKLSQIPNFLTKSLNINTNSCNASNITSNSLKSYNKDREKSSSFLNLNIDTRNNLSNIASSNVSVANNASVSNLNICCNKKSFIAEHNDDSSLNLSMQNTVLNLFENKIYKQMQPPKSPQEIVAFVEQLFSILNKYKFKGSYQMKVELETRYSDYLNQALKPDYFKECLASLQTKIFYKLNSVMYFQHEANLKEKEKNLINSDDANLNSNNNFQINNSSKSSEIKEKDKSKESNKERYKEKSIVKDNKELFEFGDKDKELKFLNSKRKPLPLEVKNQILSSKNQFPNNFQIGFNHSDFKSHHTQEFLSPKNERITTEIKSFTHDAELSEPDNSISFVNDSFNKPLDYCSTSVLSNVISSTMKNKSSKILQTPQNNNNEKTNKSQNLPGSPSIIF